MGEWFAGLSYVFLGMREPGEGTALVDTAAQHGLVGSRTLQRHDQYLQDLYGLRVQWSSEDGGLVRLTRTRVLPMCPLVYLGNAGCYEFK